MINEWNNSVEYSLGDIVEVRTQVRIKRKAKRNNKRKFQMAVRDGLWAVKDKL